MKGMGMYLKLVKKEAHPIIAQILIKFPINFF